MRPSINSAEFIECIDAYIEIGSDYETAYEYALDDRNRGLLDCEDDTPVMERQPDSDNTIELLIKQAMKRGYGYNEAVAFVNTMIAHRDAGRLTKMQKMINSLCE